MIPCSFCGRSFTPREGDAACASCTISQGCGKAKCPYCGYENQRPLSDAGGLLRKWLARSRAALGME